MSLDQQNYTPTKAQSSNEKVVELSFMGSLMFEDATSKIALAINEGVSAEWFAEDRCRAMWIAASEIWSEKANDEQIDTIELIRRADVVAKKDPKQYGDISIGVSFFDECSRYSCLSDITVYIKMLREIVIARSLKDAIRKSSDDIRDGHAVGYVAGELQRRVSEIQSAALAHEDEGCYDLTMANIESWRHAREEVQEKDNRNFVLGLPTVWEDVSKRIRGFQTGMHVIAARPSVGKTSFGLQIALGFIKQGLHVGFNSLDMPIGQLMKRPISHLAQVPLDTLDNGYPKKEEFDRVLACAEKVREWQSKGLFTLTQKRSVYEFSSWCSVLHAEGKLDVVFVDYIQKMTAGRLHGEEAMKEVSSVTSTIAKRLNIPVIALAQLNRGSENAEGGERPPKISDIRESGAIEQDAYTIFLLYNDVGTKAFWAENPPMMMDLRTEHDPGESLKPVWVHLAKNQNGRQMLWPFVVYENTFTWYMGDPKAEKNSGVGANMPRFSRITPDGRDPEFERMLEKAGYLVTDTPHSSPENMPESMPQPSTFQSLQQDGDLPPDDAVSVQDMLI